MFPIFQFLRLILALCCITFALGVESKDVPEWELLSGSKVDTRRHLSSDDFALLNDIIKDVKVEIPGSYEIRERLIFATVVLVIDGISCSDIEVRDMSISHARVSNTLVEAFVDVSELDLTCEFSYRYEYGFIDGSGTARIETQNNTLSLGLDFTSPNFEQEPPNTSDVDSCLSTINVVDLQFFGDLLGDLIERLGDPVRELIGGVLEDLACDELSSLGTSFLDDFLDLAGSVLDIYEEDLDPSLTDPFYLERNSSLPENLLPLGSLGTTDTLSWLSGLLEDFAETLIGDELGGIETSNSTEGLSINNFIRENLLDTMGLFRVGASDIQMDNVLFKSSSDLLTTQLVLDNIAINGLDSMTVFNPIDQIGESTLQAEVVWELLEVELALTLEVEALETESSTIQSDRITETLSLSFGMENIEVLASLFVVVDASVFDEITIGQLVQADSLISCALPILRESRIAGLEVNPRRLISPILSGFASQGMQEVIGNSAEAVFEMYLGAFESALPSIFQLGIRDILNSAIFESIGTSDESCAAATGTGTSNQFVDFRDLFLRPEQALELGGSGTEPYGSVVSELVDFVERELIKLDDSTGLSEINRIAIAPLTENQSNETGSLFFPGKLFGGNAQIQVGGLDSNIELSVRDTRIHNLDTIGAPLDLFAPVAGQGQTLNNTLSIGVGDRPLMVNFDILFAVLGDENTQIRNDISVSLQLSRATFGLGTLLSMLESSFNRFPIRDILNIDCWMATIPPPTLDDRGVRLEGQDPTAVLTNIVASLANMNLKVTCETCSSPRMNELVELLSYSGSLQDASSGIQEILSTVEQLTLDDLLQVGIDRALNDAPSRCPHHPNYDPSFLAGGYEAFTESSDDESATFLLILCGTILAVLVLLGVVMLIIKLIVLRRHRRFLSKIPEEQVQQILRKQAEENREEEKLNLGTLAMVSSPDIPTWIRLGMPVIILGNIFFFLSGHLSLGATVNIVFEFAGDKIEVGEFFEFAMARSTVDIWNAGGRELSILILIFSGIWPYTKQIITLVLWFTPPTRVSTSRRWSILLWLDWLAKWSMLDIFVLVISIVAFRVSIQSPKIEILPDDFLAVDLLVVPQWGLYANMIAQLISQISSHFIIHYHRKIVSDWKLRKIASQVNTTATNDSTTAGYTQPRLKDHRFGRPHRGENEKLVPRASVGFILVSSAAILLTLIFLGSFWPSVKFDVFGLVGILVEAGQDIKDASRSFSVFTIVRELYYQASTLGTPSSWIGILILASVFIVTVFLVPLVQCSALLWQWFAQSRDRRRRRVSIAIEILQAWQYAEVYLLSIIVAGWQLGSISDFMINPFCGPINPVLAQLAYFGFIAEEDTQCFRIESSIDEGFYLLLAGALVLTLLNTFVQKAVIQYFRDTSEISRDDAVSDLETDPVKQPVGAMVHDVKPVPVLFSDTFRWALTRDSCTDDDRSDTEDLQRDN